MAQQPEPAMLDSLTTDNGVRDLAANVPGAAARAKQAEVYARAPVVNSLLRVFGAKTHERAWRIGADGEEKVGRELAKLGGSWRVLHAIGVGDNDCDIDHVVIGPGGVITLNTKCHPGAKAWVVEHALKINGQSVPYLRNSRFEARRAQRLLAAAIGRPVAVTPAVVFVGLDDLKLKQMPPDVHITTKPRLVRWLQSLPVSMNGDAIDEVYGVARLSSTWK